MMLWNIIISILIIIVLHTLWNYIKDTFTSKKKKYINNEVEKYRQIMEEYSFSKPVSDDFSIIEKDLDLFLQNNI